MAKLDNVKTLDMVDGEITKVEYDEAVYVRDGKFEGNTDVGNLLLCTYAYSDFTEGEFYEVIKSGEDAVLSDNDANPYIVRSKFAVFRKVSEKPFTLDTLEECTNELDERVTALETDKKPERKLKVGDKVRTLARGQLHAVQVGEVGEVHGFNYIDTYTVRVTTEDDHDYFRPQDLELVTDKPWKKGDKVRHKRTGKVVTVYAYQPKKRTYGREAGYEFAKVAEGFTYIDEFDFEYWDSIEDYELITESEYVPEYERAVSPPFQVGEYVRVIEGKHVHEGKVVKIIADDFCDEYPYDTELLDGLEGDCYSAEQLEKVTDEEVKLAKLGRKPGEFKKGDIVRVYWTVEKGQVNELAEIYSGPVGNSAGGNYCLDGGKGNTLGVDVELVAPVESRVDL